MSGPPLRLIRPVAQGATGSVHLAELVADHGGFSAGTRVAVKRPLPGVGVDLLDREAEVLDAVRHPGLVAGIGRGQDDEGPYLVTEWLAGTTLSDRLLQGPLDPDEVQAIGASVAGALASLHAAGWLHGDVAPDNVRTDGDGRARLLDLGFATRLGAGGRGRGTPAYLAPEELEGRPKDAAAEVFALGLVLRTIATGAHPLTVDVRDWVPEGLPASDAYDKVPPAWVVEPNLPPQVDAILEALLHPDPARRPTAARAHELLADGRSGGTLPTRAVPRATPPWAGRGESLDRIRAIWGSARRTERAQVLWLSGRTGVGRSRFVREAVARLRDGETPPLHLAARCGGALESRPAQPVRALLRRWLDLPRHVAPGAREEAMLRSLRPPRTAEALLASLDPKDERPLAAEPALLADWWCALASKRPLVVLLSDLDRAGQGTLEVVGRVASGLAGTGALTILDRRAPVEASDPRDRLGERFAAFGDTHELELRPLDAAETVDLVENWFVSHTPTLRVAEALHDRTDGRANLIAAVLRRARQDGQVRTVRTREPRLAERYELLADVEALPWPLSEAGELFSALDVPARTWLHRCAVAGKRLEPAFLEAAWPGTAADLSAAQALERLEATGWLERRQAVLRFASPSLREAALADVDAAARRTLHREAAAALEGSDEQDTTQGRAFERAFHLQCAEDWDALLDQVLDLIDRTALVGHPERAVSMASWGLEALDHGARHVDPDRARFDLLTTAADAAGRAGNRDQERRALDRLVDLPLDPNREPARVGVVYLLHGHHAVDTGRFGLARGMLQNAVDRLESARSRDRASEARRRLAEVHLAAGDHDAARLEARQARRRARSTPFASFARLTTAEVGLLEDRFEPALRQVDRVLRKLRDADAGPVATEVRTRAALLRSRILRQLGRWRRAYASIDQAEREARRCGIRSLEAEVEARRGRLLVDLGREREATRVLRDVLWTAHEIQDPRIEVLGSLFLGTLLAEQNDPEGAPHLARAAERAHAVGLPRLEGLALALTARVAWHAGDLERADERAGAAVATVERVGAEFADRAVILATRALVLESRGAAEAARALDADLQQQVASIRSSIRTGLLRRRHTDAMTLLIASARSPQGPIYPRARDGTLDDPPWREGAGQGRTDPGRA